MAANVEKDDVSGQDTTGHEWDGIKELNTPLPRWWVWVFYATIVWSVVYWVLYPAWPIGDGYTKGVLGYSSRGALVEQMERAEAAKGAWIERFRAADVHEIAEDAELRNYAIAGGRIAFAENCAACHGQGGAGIPGYPALVDDVWLWGGTLDEIEQSIRYGIRADHDMTRISEMPAFGELGILSNAEINEVTEYVLQLSGGEYDADLARRGEEIYLDQCAACHMDDGSGLRALGAPALNNQIWLFGGSREEIAAQTARPRHGVMPPWEGRLDDTVIKQLTVYVHALGGGE